jgi:hypothetical protein
VFAAVITSVFLSGLSTGQLVQLLPEPLVPAGVRTAVLAAAAARPAVATAANSLPQGSGSPGPVTQTLQDISNSAASAAAFKAVSCSLDMHSGWCEYNATAAALGALMMGQERSSMLKTSACPLLPLLSGLNELCVSCPEQAVEHFSPPAAAAAAAIGGTAAADHLLLLLVLEHILLFAMLLVFMIIPDKPLAVRVAKQQRQAALELYI